MSEASGGDQGALLKDFAISATNIPVNPEIAGHATEEQVRASVVR